MNIETSLVLLWLVGIATGIAGWVTNVLWTFNQSDLGNILLGAVGIVCAPVGAVHGIYTWF